MQKEFSNILLNKDVPVKEALKKLDQLIEKTLFVIDESQKLIGSLTDGDIRRWILNEGSLSETVEKVCFKGTYFVKSDYEIDVVKKEVIAREIEFVPVLNEKNQIIEFLVSDKLFDGTLQTKVNKSLNVPVLIMAGGKGTRMEPFTRILPKPLIPIGDKSILEIIINRFLEFDVDHFYISINHKAKIIKSFFEELQPNYKISYVYEEQPLGTVGALKYLEGEFSGNIILTNCDIIINADYFDLLQHHIKNENLITLVASVKHYNIPYGICQVENGGDLIKIDEKPEYEFLVNTGMYVINSKALRHIPKNKFFHVTHLIEEIKKNSGKIGIYPIGENAWYDTGEWKEYKKVMDHFDGL
jgi:dTDP-glucose pyrophosphorylase